VVVVTLQTADPVASPLLGAKFADLVSLLCREATFQVAPPSNKVLTKRLGTGPWARGSYLPRCPRCRSLGDSFRNSLLDCSLDGWCSLRWGRGLRCLK
jgi:hypothetical protein